MDLPEPEQYNVLHLGEEHLTPKRKAQVQHTERSKVWGFLTLFGLAVMFTGIIFMNSSFSSSIQENDDFIASLVDEIGAINQENFLLEQKVSSQEGILRSIEADFSELQKALEASGGDAGELAGLFSSVLGNFSYEDAVVLSEEALTAVESDDTFDILLIGNRGAHTDTIIVASVNVAKEKIEIFSIPRDLYINGRRINEYYTYYGIDQLERMVESVTGLKIDQYAQVDLDGFVKIVDVLGGIDVYVDTAITDYNYPTENGGLQTYSIDVGHYHMDGEEALKYARSRKSTSDFDRAARQHKVLYALSNKISELDKVMDLKELTQLFQLAASYTETDINLFDLLGYYYDYKDFDLHTGFVLSVSNYLYSIINVSGAYILLPNAGNFTEIQNAIADLVN